MSKKPTLLISGAITPYPLQHWHDPATDLARQRFTKNQDIFTLQGHWHLYGGHLIAQNISVPTVVLDHPTLEDFEREVQKRYDYVAITSLSPNMDDCLRMFELVRKFSPKSKTIFGSYAAYNFAASYPEEEQKKWVDYVVTGPNSIKFMRELVGDQPDAPIHQHFFPLAAYALPWLDKYPSRQTGTLFPSVGCPQGCDFCITTAQYQQQRVELLSPRDLVEELRLLKRKWPEIESVCPMEEDSIYWIDYWQEFKRLIHDDQDFRLDELEFFVTSSVASLSQWDDPDDWARCGITNAFIGLESKFAPFEGYEKRIGDTAERLVKELRKRGISNSVGLMIGFDFHTRDNIFEDIEWIVSLEPARTQVTIATPNPGTPLFDRLVEENRIRPFKWEEIGFFGGGLIPKNFYRHELSDLVTYAEKRLYETWGPTIMRQLKVDIEGYEYFIGHKDPKLRNERASLHRKKSHKLYPLIKACWHFAPNGRVRKLIKDIEKRWEWNFGKPTTALRIQSEFILAKAAQEKLRNFVYPRNLEIHVEPGKKYIYEGRINDACHNDGRLPYRVIYTTRNKSYDWNRSVKAIQDTIFAKITSLANMYDQLRGRRVDPDITATMAKGTRAQYFRPL